MIRRGYLLLLAVVLVTCSAIVFADDDDASGNIHVEVAKIDNTLPYVVLGIVGAIVIIAAVLSAVLVLRRRPSTGRSDHPQNSASGIVAGRVGLKGEPKSSFRKEDYYEEVFSRPAGVEGADIVDEKAEPVSFISEEAGPDQETGVDRYLKEDERIIINVLRMKHNACTQATLRVVTDFSKARLSRILAELEERGIIFKEQQGRKNLITLKT